jgi:hypothetical protein
MNSWLLNLFCFGEPQINAKADEIKITRSKAENLWGTGRIDNQALILRPCFIPEKVGVNTK